MNSKKTYTAPRTEVIKVKVPGVICQSPDTGAVTIDNYTEETLDW